MKHKELYLVCKDCGAKPEINKKMSSENWNVYDNKPCKWCGGEMILNVLFDESKIKKKKYSDEVLDLLVKKIRES